MTIEELHDAKVAKKAMQEFVNELTMEIDFLDVKIAGNRYRKFNGDINKDELKDISKYSPIMYGVGIDTHTLRKEITKIYKAHRKRYDDVLEQL
jgi:hypothetical protein